MGLALVLGGVGIGADVDRELGRDATVRSDAEPSVVPLVEDVTEDGGDGRMSLGFVATDAGFEARLAMLEIFTDAGGNLTVVDSLEPLAP